jgi:hypothetical protein
MSLRYCRLQGLPQLGGSLPIASAKPPFLQHAIIIKNRPHHLLFFNMHHHRVMAFLGRAYHRLKLNTGGWRIQKHLGSSEVQDCAFSTAGLLVSGSIFGSWRGNIAFLGVVSMSCALENLISVFMYAACSGDWRDGYWKVH